jgi:acyl carrier protein
MEIEQFIFDFVEATDDESANPLNSETIFRELDSWDSLAALSIMAMIDDKYQASLTADEMKSANTLGELFALIKTKH